MASEILRRNPTSTGNRRVFTWAGWVKFNKLSAVANCIWYAASAGNSEFNISLISPTGALNVYEYAPNAYQYQYVTSRLFRDFSNWFHLIVAVDTTQVREDDRFKIYVNGVLYNGTYSSENSTGVLNHQTRMNTPGEINVIGQNTAGGTTYDANCQLTDLFMVDGQALTSDVFGFYKTGKGYISAGSTVATDFRAGQWVPKSPRIIITDINSRGGFGVNGFYLPMNDSNNFGADFHCTPNSIIKLQENLPQPKCRIDGVGDYTGALRDDPFKQYLVLALPFVSGGLQNGFGDYSAAIKGGGTPKTITNSNATISTAPSYYGSTSNFTSASSSYLTTPRNIEDYNMGSGDFTVEGWVYFKSINTAQYTRFFSIGNSTNEGLCWELNVTTSTLSFIATIGADYNAVTTTFPIVANQWYHIAQVRRGTSYSLYVNGVCIGTDTTINGSINFNSNTAVVIGAWEYTIGVYDRFSDAYMQDLRIYKGVAKYTGGFDVPKPYTPVGIATWRAVPDTTANNFATLNPLLNVSTLSDGNLKTVTAGNNSRFWSNIAFPTTGKWYTEFSFLEGDLSLSFAVTPQNSNTQYSNISDGFITYLYYDTNGVNNRAVGITTGTITAPTGWQGNKIVSGVATYGSVGEIIRVSVDQDNDTITITNHSGDFTFTTPIEVRGKSFHIGYSVITTWPATTYIWNFGQNPTFSGQTTAGTFTDSNGKGLFKYQPPTGFLALCEDNLPTPAIADPGKHFKTVLYTGDGNGGRSITGVGFQPDLVWIKDRTSGTFNHLLHDSVRGTQNALRSSSISAESVETPPFLYSFDNDGFSISTQDGVNRPGNNHVAWCWKAGGPAVTNTDGTITSQVSVNQDAGFSIISWTGNATNGATIGHGLNKTPKFLIVKNRTDSTNWFIRHSGYDVGGNSRLVFDSSSGSQQDNPWGNSYWSSSTFPVGDQNWINGSSDAMIAYCWAEIEGFSKFGSYVGNGSADGPFVYCGFKPAFIITKRIDSTSSWHIADNARNSTNPNQARVWAEATSAEVDDTTNPFDFLSNGFKLRGSGTGTNASGGTYIFAAFAESPFQTANAK